MQELAFHPEALDEAVAAALYLEIQRPGYGVKFDEELTALAARILAHPKSGTLDAESPAELEVRKFPMRTFRYTLHVAEVDDRLTVFAVADQRRRPGYWIDRMG